MAIDRRYGFVSLALAVTVIALIAKSSGSYALSLSLPLDCIPQQTCFIQNYVDMDVSKETRDYTCDKASYDGHKGVDFRILSLRALKKGVDVRASAPGKVKVVRDGVADRLFRSKTARMKGRECGNGLVIDHGEGWETQYCHMRKGSLIIKKGQRVERGQKLGLIGLSGKTAFPHIHISVRHKGKVVDPFNGAEPTKGSCAAAGSGGALWQRSVLKQFPYVSGQPIMFGFAERPVEKAILVARGGVPLPRSIKAPALVFYGLVLNLQKGDQLKIDLIGPVGTISSRTTEPVNRHKATYLAFAGKRRSNFAWPAGTYKGSLTLLRGSKEIWQKKQVLELR